MSVGQAVVEVLIGVGIAAVALLALIQVATKSVSNSGLAKRQAVATAFAVEGMEWVKSRRQIEPWSAMYNRDPAGGGSSIFCLNAMPANLASLSSACSGTIGTTEFTRRVTFTSAVVTPPAGGNEQVTVVAEVSWYEGGRLTSSRQETYFLRY